MIARSFDIAVVGGGASGVAAAVAASKQGVSVILIDENELPGGLASNAEVGTICGLYAGNLPGFQYNCGRFAREFAQELQVRSASKPMENNLGLKYLPYDSHEFASLCRDLLSENVIYLQRGKLIGALQENGQVHKLRILSEGQEHSINVKEIVDASGVSVVSTLLAQPLIDWEFRQSVSQVFTVNNLDFSDEQNLSLVLMKVLRKGSLSGDLLAGDERCTLVSGSLKGQQVSMKITISYADLEENSAAEMQKECIERIHRVLGFLRAQGHAFASISLQTVAPALGIRIGDRPVGRAILRDDDVLGCRKSTNYIARGNWPVEIWNDSRQVEIQALAVQGYYDIPMDCLLSASLRNLYFAGRCIAATDRAIASARVIGTCLQTGYAAGMLAALKRKGIEEQAAIRMIQNEQFPA